MKDARWAFLAALLVVGGALSAGDPEPRTWQEAWVQVRSRLDRIDGRLERIENALMRRGAEAMDREQEPVRREPTEEEAKQAYFARFVELSDVRAKYYRDLFDGRIAAVFGKIENVGSSTLTRVSLTAYFLDRHGEIVHQQSYQPVLRASIPILDDDRTPLAPNATREFAFKAKDCPATWSEGRVRVVITDVQTKGR